MCDQEEFLYLDKKAGEILNKISDKIRDDRNIKNYSTALFFITLSMLERIIQAYTKPSDEIEGIKDIIKFFKKRAEKIIDINCSDKKEN